MKRSTAVEKSTCWTIWPTTRPTPRPGASLSSPTRPRVETNPTSSMATPVGNRSSFRFSQPMTALRLRNTAARSNTDRVMAQC